MTLEEEVLSVIRHERSLRGSARLSLREIVRRVEYARWTSLSAGDKVLHFMLGTTLSPSHEEVHDAVHELQKTHLNLVSLKPPPPQNVRLRLVQSR